MESFYTFGLIFYILLRLPFPKRKLLWLQLIATWIWWPMCAFEGSDVTLHSYRFLLPFFSWRWKLQIAFQVLLQIHCGSLQSFTTSQQLQWHMECAPVSLPFLPTDWHCFKHDTNLNGDEAHIVLVMGIRWTCPGCMQNLSPRRLALCRLLYRKGLPLSNCVFPFPLVWIEQYFVEFIKNSNLAIHPLNSCIS